jgi:SAM-dependent methyltransferase
MTQSYFFNDNNGKEQIINLALGYQLSQVLFTAVHLAIFNLLDRGGMDSRALAKALQSDENSVRRLLNVLVDLNLLEHRDHYYSNTPTASRYLVKGKSSYLGNIVQHSSNLWQFWGGLEKQVKSGCAKEPEQEYLNAFPEKLEEYLTAMQDSAAFKAETIADALSIDGFRNMLDIGCGPGTYPIAFAEYNRTLTATVIDLEPNLVCARENIRKSSAKGRIRTCTCQVLEDEIPGSGYDLVFISNLIHIYSEQEVRQIFTKAWNTLAPSGTMVIHDYILPDAGQRRLMASLFDLTMLVGTPRGRCYSNAEVSAMLKTLGAHTIRQISIDLGSSLVVGKKQCGEKSS